MLVPSLNNEMSFKLEYQNSGKKLYSKTDLNLCNSLYKIIQYTANINHANEEGMKIERQRIMRDLNDDIVIHLSKLVSNSDEPIVVLKANAILESLRETINSLDTEATIKIETVLDNLRSTINERINLVGIQLNIDIQITATTETLSPRQNINLQRIFQEIISNIIKHARASQVEVNIRQLNSVIQITICDDGIGGDINNWVAGKGMNNIKKRISEINGSVEWLDNKKHYTSEFNTGCCITLKLPI